MVNLKRSKAIFLDRDGILNEALVENKLPKAPKNINELKINFLLRDVLLELKKNYFLICVTNQPEVSRKKFNKRDVEEINTYIKDYFFLDDLLCCYHANDGECDFRKPKIGMLTHSKKKFGIILENSIVIGDRWKDIDMGNHAKCKTIFVDYSYDEKLKSRPHIILNNITNLKKILNVQF